MKHLAVMFAALLWVATPTLTQDFGPAPDQWTFSLPRAA